MKKYLIVAISYEDAWNPFLVSGEDYQGAIKKFNQDIFPEFLKTQDPNNFTDEWEDWKFSIYPLPDDFQEGTLTEIPLEYWPD